MLFVVFEPPFVGGTFRLIGANSIGPPELDLALIVFATGHDEDAVAMGNPVKKDPLVDTSVGIIVFSISMGPFILRRLNSYLPFSLVYDSSPPEAKIPSLLTSSFKIVGLGDIL